MWTVDVPVLSLCTASLSRQGGREEGSTAGLRHVLKRGTYHANDLGTYDLLLPHESSCRRGRPATEHLGKLTDVDDRSGSVRRDVFVMHALLRLSVTMCNANAEYSREGLQYWPEFLKDQSVKAMSALSSRRVSLVVFML